MGRARGQSAAVATAAFDDLMGTRRGRERGNILAPYPGAADREALNEMTAAVERGQLDQALDLLTVEHGNIARLELLEELQSRVCAQLASQLRVANAGQTEHVLRTLGFEVKPDEPLLHFATPNLNRVYQSSLAEMLDERTRARYKTGESPTAKLFDKAFCDHFAKYAGAACFQAKDEVQDRMLGGPANRRSVLTSDVTAWRGALERMVKAGSALDTEMAATMLNEAKPAKNTSPGPAPRRRQRYIR